VTPWDEGRVREGVAAIVADAESALDGVAWPLHPRDDDGEVVPADLTTLYFGAGGMIWGLRRLGSSLDLESLAASVLDRYREAPSEKDRGSLFLGETGLLALTRTDDDRLAELVATNERHPAWEVLNGSPGTILAARAAGLDDAADHSAVVVVEEWDRGDGLWTQTLGGHTAQFLGPAHGLVGNVHSLRGFLGDDELRRRVEPVLREHAIWTGDAVNWPPVVGDEPSRVQWCHGAPGIVATIGDLLPEELLLGGAETTWRTGPLEKGPGLCHGTAGNGYALLRTYELTRDEKWLERARSFAMDALDQLEQRYSLYSGDIGAALYAQACIDVDARFPIMDVL
jgi:hypothetical protein